MIFKFILVNTERRNSALYLTDMDHTWGALVETETVAPQALEGNVKGRSTYHIADAMDDVYTPSMFEHNNIIMVADRVPSIEEQPAFWSNLMRSHAIACDCWTQDQIMRLLPTLNKRFLNLTGVNVWNYQPDIRHPDDPPNDGIVYAGPDDAFHYALSEYIKHTVFRDRPDGSKIEVEVISEANRFANYHVLIAPHVHSSLWLTAMAHRSELVLHEFAPLPSYNLDPRGNSTTISSLVADQKELAGGSAFKKRIENLMDEYPLLVNSLKDNHYRRPKGDLLVDRLFIEVNRSSY